MNALPPESHRSRTRRRLLPLLPGLLLMLGVSTAAAQTALSLRWGLEEDVFRGPAALSRAAFTLTNHDTKPLGPGGWAIYFNALHGAVPGSVSGGFIIENLTGDLHRLVPPAGFAGLAPGDSIRIEYLTGLLLNVSVVPKGPYIVFDTAPDKGYALKDYTALPFERPWAGDGRGPRVVTPADQFALDSATRDLPASELPPVFPTPRSVTARPGVLRLTGLPKIQAPDSLHNEATFAAEYLRPDFGNARAGGTTSVRLETGPVEGRGAAAF